MADTEPQVTSVEKTKRKEELESLFKEFIEGGQVIGEGVPGNRLRVDKVNEEIGNKILKLNPTLDEVVEAIDNDPPVVDYLGTKLVNKRQPPIPPTPTELEFAQKEIPPENLLPETGYSKDIEKAVGGLQKFLATPRVRDSFTNHSYQRRPWEVGILEHLRWLDEKRGVSTTTGDEYYEKSYAFAVKDRLFDNNRYTRNRLLSITNTLQLINIVASDSQDPKAIEITNKTRTLIKRFDDLKTGHETTETKTIDLLEAESPEGLDNKINQASQIAIDGVKLFL